MKKILYVENDENLAWEKLLESYFIQKKWKFVTHPRDEFLAQFIGEMQPDFVLSFQGSDQYFCGLRNFFLLTAPLKIEDLECLMFNV